MPDKEFQESYANFKHFRHFYRNYKEIKLYTSIILHARTNFFFHFNSGQENHHDFQNQHNPRLRDKSVSDESSEHLADTDVVSQIPALNDTTF